MPPLELVQQLHILLVLEPQSWTKHSGEDLPRAERISPEGQNPPRSIPGLQEGIQLQASWIDVVMVGHRLESVISEAFSNLNDSGIPPPPASLRVPVLLFRKLQEAALHCCWIV